MVYGPDETSRRAIVLARGSHRPHHGRIFPRRKASLRQGRDVLFSFVDNIYRYTLAARKVSPRSAACPRVGISAHAAEEIGRCSRTHHVATKSGLHYLHSKRCTFRRTMLTDPSPATTFGAHWTPRWCCRGRSPRFWVFIPRSTRWIHQRQLDPLSWWSEDHYDTARGVAGRNCSATKSFRHHRDSRHAQLPKRQAHGCTARARFSGSCRNRSTWAKVFTGQDGKIVPLRRTPSAGFQAIIAGELRSPARAGF